MAAESRIVADDASELDVLGRCVQCLYARKLTHRTLHRAGNKYKHIASHILSMLMSRVSWFSFYWHNLHLVDIKHVIDTYVGNLVLFNRKWIEILMSRLR